MQQLHSLTENNSAKFRHGIFEPIVTNKKQQPFLQCGSSKIQHFHLFTANSSLKFWYVGVFSRQWNVRLFRKRKSAKSNFLGGLKEDCWGFQTVLCYYFFICRLIAVPIHQCAQIGLFPPVSVSKDQNHFVFNLFIAVVENSWHPGRVLMSTFLDMQYREAN